ncbi:MAG: GIY-YIG nuclease family protein [Bacteroidia bacterium]|nr:GIY-YIG nuclease family protein [Bacteroidia bacterium]NNJ55180.1 GIY-YIG nuclease family protein [Bacteroidia bacterium]
MRCFVYILKSEKNESLYIGITEDIEKRLQRHNSGYVSSTKSKIPWKLLYSVSYQNRSEAFKVERKLKNLKSRKRVYESIKNQSPSAEQY